MNPNRRDVLKTMLLAPVAGLLPVVVESAAPVTSTHLFSKADIERIRRAVNIVQSRQRVRYVRYYRGGELFCVRAVHCTVLGVSDARGPRLPREMTWDQ